ncbi:MAG: multicopper oxidase domain-containing protein [Chitinophagales bacterium]|nr:multicopper oxidase domain-containing protein [Chitinophagales bacterium]
MKCQHIFCFIFLIFLSQKSEAQNPLYIPPTLSGTNFQLNVQSGTQTFFNGWNTPTYGINGSFLSPTLILNKNDVVALHVTNNLNDNTTMHWHGLHVPAVYDGGPHQIIEPATTWDATFKVLNDAGTYWYHPHGDGKTDLQVSKGLAGIIIIKDSMEAALDLPRTYGVDDFPVIVQTKAFDILYQIAIATEMDTAIMVNGTLHPYLDAPAQVVRLRILDGSSMRSYDFGFSNGMTFYQIGGDGGLLEAPVELTRLRLVPGERAEILVDLSALQGQTIFLKSFASELEDGIYGAETVGNGMVSIPDYGLNSLNGADFNILQINVTTPTANPVNTIPTSLATVTPLNESDAGITRTFTFAPQDMMPMSQMVEGPFTINGAQFSMDSINITAYKNTTEIWKLNNQTLIAHPFHIHDVQFFILDENGNTPPLNEQGKKDVVLVMPMETVRVIMKFEDYTNDTVPYMYHCHMLHHEDDGMMGSFAVRDSATVGIDEVGMGEIKLFPNPADDFLLVTSTAELGNNILVRVIDLLGNEIKVPAQYIQQSLQLNVSAMNTGIYFIQISDRKNFFSQKLLIQHY